MKKSVAVVLFFWLSLFAATSYGAPVALMGPQPYLRTTGQPNVYSATFKGIPGAGTLVITNGDPAGAVRVVALISINGGQVVGGNTFNAPYSSKAVPVTLARDNTISIELRGEPGNYLTVTVTGDITCTALDQCHVPGTWDRTSGACSNPEAGNGTTCGDGNACTQTDTCQSGVCVGASPIVCHAQDQCHVAGVCNPADGTCSNPTAANDTPCNDGSACTLGDSCQNGSCRSSAFILCRAQDQCHAAGVCNPADGTCSNPTAANDTPCNDGNACTQSDTCQSGVCGGSAITCGDNNACTTDTCDPAVGCVHTDQRTPLSIAPGLPRYSLTSPDGRVSLFNSAECNPWSGWYFQVDEPDANYCGPTAGMNLLRWYDGPPPEDQPLWLQLGSEMRTNDWMGGKTILELVGACGVSCGEAFFWSGPVVIAACTAACSIMMEDLVNVGTLPADVENTLAARTPSGYQLIRKRGDPGLAAFETLLREGNPIAVLLWTGSTLHWTVVGGTYDSGGTVMVRFANHSDQTWDWFKHQWSLDGLDWPGETILGWHGIDDYVSMYYEKATVLDSGQYLNVGQENAIYSQDGRFMFFLDTAGHLVLYPVPLTLGTALWGSGNAVVDAVALGYWVYMNPNGNLVIYDAAWHDKWSSNTDGHPGAYLSIQNDGNLVIYDVDRHTVLWQSHTGGHY